MMLVIVKARQVEHPVSCDSEADRGPDFGDDPRGVVFESDTETESWCTSVPWDLVPKKRRDVYKLPMMI